MSTHLPEYLIQGEPARLFPVLSTTSKEGRTTSIVLACLSKIDEFGARLLGSLGQRVGARSSIETFTEVVFQNHSLERKDRPDGLIVLKTGSKEWRVLVETKIASNELSADQIERYRKLAKDNSIDCVLTISNQFASSPDHHPLASSLNKRLKVPVFHWSWMHILTEADLLLSQDDVRDADQKTLLNELRRFLSHESAGVKGFDRMPKSWTELNRLVSSGGDVKAKSSDAIEVVGAWHQETRDLSLILSRMTETNVSEKMSRKHKSDASVRTKDALTLLSERTQLCALLEVPDTAAAIEIVADLPRRAIDVGMTLRAPEDKVSTKARVNWLLRQIRSSETSDVYVRLLWPGSAAPTQFLAAELLADVAIAEVDKKGMSPHAFHIFLSKKLGARFAQQTNFIVDLEELVPDFYQRVGSKLIAWKKSAPSIKKDKSSAEDVRVDAISEDAGDFES